MDYGLIRLELSQDSIKKDLLKQISKLIVDNGYKIVEQQTEESSAIAFIVESDTN